MYKALNRWKLLKNKIDKSDFDSSILINRGNKLFYKFGTLFLLLDQLLLKINVKK